MNSNAQVVQNLTQSDMFQTYERAFSDTTGLPLTLRPVEYLKLPFQGKRKENRWCSLMAAQSQTCSACLLVQEKIAEGAMNGATTVTCAYGLFETALPVKLGQETIGFLQTGQAMQRKPNNTSWQSAYDRARQGGFKLPEDQAKDVYFSTPVVSSKALESVTTLLGIFGEHLSIKSNQIALRAANAEPPVIVRAKKYIQEHHSEDLSLGQVAASVHSSVFYFCKLFRKVTGTTFTEYVSRTRVERAKQLLVNPHLRISEIAYEVGFQSLTHFNRVFKHLQGESPTCFRERLPKSQLRERRT